MELKLSSISAFLFRQLKQTAMYEYLMHRVFDADKSAEPTSTDWLFVLQPCKRHNLASATNPF